MSVFSRDKSLTFISGHWAQRGCSLFCDSSCEFLEDEGKREGLGGSTIASRLFADDGPLLASLHRSHQYALGWPSVLRVLSVQNGRMVSSELGESCCPK